MATSAARATTLATRIPLVHYPARAPVSEIVTWQTLSSRERQGGRPPRNNHGFDRLRWQHVFFFAGPSCYGVSDAAGDSVLYFRPEAESERAGGASPFDSGALQVGRLQPWATRKPAQRWALLEKHTHALDKWRVAFAGWLERCYGAPDRYLDVEPDIWSGGLPDRTEPSVLRDHNGSSGQSRYAGRCADRRAWTWEVRVAPEVSFDSLAILHVPQRRFRSARRWATELGNKFGTDVRVAVLAGNLPPGPASFYRDSARVLREAVS